jgi:hypothetical protein
MKDPLCIYLSAVLKPPQRDSFGRAKNRYNMKNEFTKQILTENGPNFFKRTFKRHLNIHIDMNASHYNVLGRSGSYRILAFLVRSGSYYKINDPFSSFVVRFVINAVLAGLFFFFIPAKIKSAIY